MKKLTILVALLLALGTGLHAYVISQYKWGVPSVGYYINPTNSQGIPETEVVRAVQAGAQVWMDQTDANIQLVYLGRSSGTTYNLFNSLNEVNFVDGYSEYGNWVGSIGQARYVNTTLVEGDIAFYQQVYPFFAFSGCTGAGIYIESIAVHEFGHVLGIWHSDVPGAVMQPYMPAYCDQSYMQLTSDDVAALEALYPPVAEPPPTPIALTARAYKVKGFQEVDLTWSGLTGVAVDIFRNNVLSAQTANDGAYTDHLNKKGGGTYTYRICIVSTCTSNATASF